VSADPGNDFRSGDTDNNVLRKILNRLLTVSEANGGLINPEFSAARLGMVGGKAAVSFHIMARRAGFNSTSILQDVAEFLGASIDAMPELTGAESLEVVSASGSDIAVSGSGARTIQVTYLDTSGNLVTSADIALNGDTAVPLGFKSIQIIWMVVTSAGSGTVAAGNILLRIASAGATHEQITAGGNRSLSSHFRVPSGYTAYLTDWHVSAIGATTQDARLRATVLPVSRALSSTYIFQDTAYVAAAGALDRPLPYLVVPALAKIKVSTFTGNVAGTNRIDADYSVLLISNT
jgi:hypothetical protein